MHRLSSRVTSVSTASGLYRLYCQSRLIGEAVTVDNDALHVSHLLCATGRVVASLGDAANWLETIEHANAVPLAVAA